jgi:PQQ-dependent catabolism-associated beta-propeller protein
MMSRRPAYLLLLAIGLLAGCRGDRPVGADGTIRIGAVLAPGEAGAGFRRGVEMGAVESARAAELTGRRFEVLTEEAATARAVRRAVRRLSRVGAFAIVGGADDAACRELGRSAAERQLLFLNIGCADDRLRHAPPPTTFHVAGSAWMYAEAANTAAASAQSAGVPVLWHPELVRFGAAQLNERFERRFGEAPDERAWAGWMAVKILWEGASRSGSADPRRVAAFLLEEATAFDGHKGQSLAFSATDRQLRQPLYVIDVREGATVPLEVDPLSGASAGLAAGEWSRLEGRPVGEGRYLVISNEGSGDVSVVDAASGAVVSRIRVGSRPRGIRTSGDGRFVYVALSDDAPTLETEEDGIAVIDLRRGEVVRRYSAGTDPEVFDLSLDERHLYASNEDAGTATVTDLATGEIIATLLVGIEPEGVATSPDGRWVYVTAETSNTVSVIDTRTNTVAASFLVEVRPRAAAFSPVRPVAYVTNEISATVSVVDTNRHVVVDAIELPNRAATPVGVTVAPDGSRLYVATGHANSVTVIDAETHEVIADVPVGRRPWGIAVSADGSRVYSANGITNDVSEIDTATLRVVRTIRVGQRPWGVAVTP